jgi:hypothetical protein
LHVLPLAFAFSFLISLFVFVFVQVIVDFHKFAARMSSAAGHKRALEGPSRPSEQDDNETNNDDNNESNNIDAKKAKKKGSQKVHSHRAPPHRSLPTTQCYHLKVFI